MGDVVGDLMYGVVRVKLRMGIVKKSLCASLVFFVEVMVIG